MTYQYFLNPFSEDAVCPKCSYEGPHNFKFCTAQPEPKSHSFLTEVLTAIPEEPESPYCAVFLLSHLDVTCARCAFIWYSATADMKPDMVGRVNRIVLRKRKNAEKGRLSEEWPEMISVGK